MDNDAPIVVTLWQAQGTDGFRMSTEEIRKRIETMNRKMRRRTFDGYLVCATLIVFFVGWMFVGMNSLQTVGAVLTIIGVSYLAWQIRQNRFRALLPAMPATRCEHLRTRAGAAARFSSGRALLVAHASLRSRAARFLRRIRAGAAGKSGSRPHHPFRNHLIRCLRHRGDSAESLDGAPLSTTDRRAGASSGGKVIKRIAVVLSLLFRFACSVRGGRIRCRHPRHPRRSHRRAASERRHRRRRHRSDRPAHRLVRNDREGRRVRSTATRSSRSDR